MRNSEFMAALYEADNAASQAHDAIWADPFDRKAASESIWRIHNAIRPLLDNSPAGDPDLTRCVLSSEDATRPTPASDPQSNAYWKSWGAAVLRPPTPEGGAGGS